jgi:hypothetical protein
MYKLEQDEIFGYLRDTEKKDDYLASKFEEDEEQEDEEAKNVISQLYPNFQENEGKQRLQILEDLFTGSNETMQRRKQISTLNKTIFEDLKKNPELADILESPANFSFSY